MWDRRVRAYFEYMLKQFAHEASWYADEAEQLIYELELHASKREGDKTFQRLERLVSVITNSANIVWPRKKKGLPAIRGRAIRMICGFPEREDEFLHGVRRFRDKMTHFEEHLEQRRYKEHLMFGLRKHGNFGRLHDLDILFPTTRFSVNCSRMDFFIELSSLRCHALGEVFDLRHCGSEPSKIAQRMNDTVLGCDLGFYNFSEEFDMIVEMMEPYRTPILSRRQIKELIARKE